MWIAWLGTHIFQPGHSLACWDGKQVGCHSVLVKACTVQQWGPSCRLHELSRPWQVDTFCVFELGTPGNYAGQPAKQRLRRCWNESRRHGLQNKHNHMSTPGCCQGDKSSAVQTAEDNARSL